MFRFSFAITAILAVFCFLSCQKGNQHVTPFSRTFYAETERGDYQINLHRYTSGDTLTFYSGYVVHEHLQKGEPLGVSTQHKTGVNNLLFRFTQEEELRVKINRPGDELTGWLVRLDSKSGKELDSIPFNGKAVQFPVSFDYQTAFGKSVLYPEIGNGPAFEYEFELLNPENQSLDSLVFKQFRYNLYRRYEIPDTVGNLIQYHSDKHIEERFKYDKQNTAEDYSQGQAYAVRTYLAESYRIFVNRPRFVSIIESQFEGSSDAAHSTEGVYFVNYDLNTGNRIQLGDVLNRQGYQVISRLITQKIREKSGLVSGQSLRDAWYHVDRVDHSNNFFLTPFGIGFQYNIYEIAPYANGPTRIFIPFSELEGGVYQNILDLVRL